MIKAGEELLRLQAENQRLKKGIKQAREEIKNINPVYSTIGDRIPVLKNCDDIKSEVLAILDKLTESEG